MEESLAPQLQFRIVDWLASSIPDARERETLASLEISLGPAVTPVTRVEDLIARSVRSHINVSTYAIARWLLVNWWRLRWEPFREGISYEWLCSHSMASISGDYAWPPLTIASDGEYVHFRSRREATPDVGSVQYLRSVRGSVPATRFELAVDEFLEQVHARLNARIRQEGELSELITELREDRASPEQSELCKLQALAGIDPGDAPDDWLSKALKLARDLGSASTEEVLAVVPALEEGISDAESAISAMRASSILVNMQWARLADPAAEPNELPWQRGVRLAHDLRSSLGIGSGPLGKGQLEQLVECTLPLPGPSSRTQRHLGGGYRNGAANGGTKIVVLSPWEPNQRFYLARMIGAALLFSPDQRILPVSSASTALQKFQRSFAQEFLCPWQDLDEFTNAHGLDGDSISAAAKHFSVSEHLVLSTLVNKGKLTRDHLPE